MLVSWIVIRLLDLFWLLLIAPMPTGFLIIAVGTADLLLRRAGGHP